MVLDFLLVSLLIVLVKEKRVNYGLERRFSW